MGGTDESGGPCLPRADGARVTTSDVHTFVVPTYGRSPHLEACLESLRRQSAPSAMVVATSTPFAGLEELCEGFGARLVVHGPNRGIGNDWNRAIEAATTPLVTVAHQDDIYLPGYSAAMLEAHRARPEASLYFCDTGEVTDDGRPRADGLNLRVKRLLVGAAFVGRGAIRGPVARRLLLGLGNAVVCPAVTLNMRLSPHFRFREDLRTNMDWLAWLELAEIGPVAYVPRRLMDHRVHPESETARCLDDGTRRAEDALVLERLWPRPIAGLIGRLYSRSYQEYL